jgi:DNA mismatch endonuclease (patch repair protein)
MKAARADGRRPTVPAVPMNAIAEPSTSLRMRRVRQRNTEPERLTRRMLFALGARFRTCARDLPGRPDVVNRTRAWALFVHGCFWHGHARCRLATIPKTNTRWWLAKLEANRIRDRRKVRELRNLGFLVEVIWQCEVERPSVLRRRVAAFLARSQELGGTR